MKHYWQHFKGDKERGVEEIWYLALSKCNQSPNRGWLYSYGENKWSFIFLKFNTDKKDFEYKLSFENMSKSEAMKRCVAILKLLNEMENGK